MVMRMVFDTNVVVSACFWRGAPFDCLAAWAQGRLQAAISPPLLAEYEDVFAELTLDYPRRKPVDWVAALRDSADLVFPIERATGVTKDPFDEMVLECALAAQADCIVSSDKKRLLPLRHYRDIPILNPSEVLRRFAL
jgi:uncharacterized protein